MAFDIYEFREDVVKPALAAINLLSASAVNLLLGTCAQETAFGTFLIQKKIGYEGGLGIYQMERNTYNFVWDAKVQPSPAVRAKIRVYLGYDGKPPAYRLVSDLALATIMARLYYHTFTEPLPEPNDIPGLARYYKLYWNTPNGAATEQQFISNYERYVAKCPINS